MALDYSILGQSQVAQPLPAIQQGFGLGQAMAKAPRQARQEVRQDNQSKLMEMYSAWGGGEVTPENFAQFQKTMVDIGAPMPRNAGIEDANRAMEVGGSLFQMRQQASGAGGGARGFQPRPFQKVVGQDEEGNDITELWYEGISHDPKTNQYTTQQWKAGGQLTGSKGLTAQQEADLAVDTKGRETEITEQTKVEVKVKPENVKRVADSEAKIAAMTETAKLNARDAGNLRSTDTMREFNIKKAESFLEGFTSGDRNSGVGRKVSKYLPVGVWTDQGEFDEKLDAFAETAAREKLKASGEIRPTDADVQGMKQAMFGIGRDEDVNIQLLQEYIMEQKALSERLDAYDSNLNQEQAPKTLQAKRDELQSQFSTPQSQGETYEQRAARLLN